MRTTSIITLAAAAAVLMMLSPAPEVQAAETMKPEQCLMCHGGSFDALREQTKNWKDLDRLSSPINTLILMPLTRMPAQRLCRSARAAIRLTRFRFPRTLNPNPPHCRCATGAITWRISKSAAMQAATKNSVKMVSLRS